MKPIRVVVYGPRKLRKPVLASTASGGAAPRFRSCAAGPHPAAIIVATQDATNKSGKPLVDLILS